MSLNELLHNFFLDHLRLLCSFACKSTCQVLNSYVLNHISLSGAIGGHYDVVRVAAFQYERNLIPCIDLSVKRNVIPKQPERPIYFEYCLAWIQSSIVKSVLMHFCNVLIFLGCIIVRVSFENNRCDQSIFIQISDYNVMRLFKPHDDWLDLFFPTSFEYLFRLQLSISLGALQLQTSQMRAVIKRVNHSIAFAILADQIIIANNDSILPIAPYLLIKTLMNRDVDCDDFKFCCGNEDIECTVEFKEVLMKWSTVDMSVSQLHCQTSFRNTRAVNTRNTAMGPSISDPILFSFSCKEYCQRGSLPFEPGSQCCLNSSTLTEISIEAAENRPIKFRIGSWELDIIDTNILDYHSRENAVSDSLHHITLLRVANLCKELLTVLTRRSHLPNAIIECGEGSCITTTFLSQQQKLHRRKDGTQKMKPFLTIFESSRSGLCTKETGNDIDSGMKLTGPSLPVTIQNLCVPPPARETMKCACAQSQHTCTTAASCSEYTAMTCSCISTSTEDMIFSDSSPPYPYKYDNNNKYGTDIVYETCVVGIQLSCSAVRACLSGAETRSALSLTHLACEGVRVAVIVAPPPRHGADEFSYFPNPKWTDLSPILCETDSAILDEYQYMNFGVD